MKIFTLGKGFVADHLPYHKITERAPICDTWLKVMLRDYKPDVIVNCIGKTGRPNIDWCESHKEETMEANVTIPLLLSDYCAKNNVHLIQIGSGCVYFGHSPCRKIVENSNGHFDWKEPGWREKDFANPQSYYSKSKYACDLMLGQMPHVTTLRLRMPISEKDVPRNLINKLKGYKQIIDIPNSMTFMSDLTRCIEWAANNRPGGIFHVTNPQPLTAARIMKEYQKYVPEHQFDIITEQELDALTVAKRSNCILSTDKLKQAGFTMTDSEEALTKCMANYVKNMRSNNVK
jgi:dTDP-4-dehydrorhamnose reductase